MGNGVMMVEMQPGIHLVQMEGMEVTEGMEEMVAAEQMVDKY